MGVRWPKVTINTELWEAAVENRVILQIGMRQWRWIGHTVRMGDESGLESAGSQEERKTEEKLENIRF
jgi:hypothetical protein